MVNVNMQSSKTHTCACPRPLASFHGMCSLKAPHIRSSNPFTFLFNLVLILPFCMVSRLPQNGGRCCPVHRQPWGYHRYGKLLAEHAGSSFPIPTGVRFSKAFWSNCWALRVLFLASRALSVFTISHIWSKGKIRNGQHLPPQTGLNFTTTSGHPHC